MAEFHLQVVFWTKQLSVVRCPLSVVRCQLSVVSWRKAMVVSGERVAVWVDRVFDGVWWAEACEEGGPHLYRF